LYQLIRLSCTARHHQRGVFEKSQKPSTVAQSVTADIFITAIPVVRAGLEPIGPIASNRAPRQRGPRATPTNLRKHTFIQSCMCGPGAGPTVFFRRGPRCQPKNKSKLRDLLTSLIIIIRSFIVKVVIAFRLCIA